MAEGGTSDIKKNTAEVLALIDEAIDTHQAGDETRVAFGGFLLGLHELLEQHAKELAGTWKDRLNGGTFFGAYEEITDGLNSLGSDNPHITRANEVIEKASDYAFRDWRRIGEVGQPSDPINDLYEELVVLAGMTKLLADTAGEELTTRQGSDVANAIANLRQGRADVQCYHDSL